MKVLVCTPSLEKEGGVSGFFKSLRGKLRADYFTVGSRQGRGKGPLGTLARIVDDTLRFSTLMAGSRYELVHLNPSLDYKAIVRDGILLTVAKKSGKKTVVFFHGWKKNVEAQLTNRYRKLFARVFFEADAIIVLGSEFARSLVQMGCRKPVYVLTTAVDDSIFPPSPEEEEPRQQSPEPAQALPPPHGDDDGGPRPVLFLSRIERSKGIYETLEAFKQLKVSLPAAKLVVAGDGAELMGAKEFARTNRLNDVHFLGHIEGKEKLEVMRRAGVYILPSYTEGMPISVLEAMASGLPVITCPVGGLKDFFEDGAMGFAAAERGPELLSRLMEKLLTDDPLRVRIGSFNRTYSGRFSASNVAARIQDIYREVLDVH